MNYDEQKSFDRDSEHAEMREKDERTSEINMDEISIASDDPSWRFNGILPNGIKPNEAY